MTLLDDTKAILQQLTTDVQNAIAAGTQADQQQKQKIADQQAQIQALIAQVNAGGVVTATDLQFIHDGIASVDTNVLAAVKNVLQPQQPAPPTASTGSTGSAAPSS